MPTTAKVKVNEIEAISQQPRKQVGDVSDLVRDIQQTGRFYSAVTLERTAQGGLRVISGSRRLKAAQEAELAVVPAIIYEADEMDAVTRLRMQIGENNTRRSLSAMETALSYYELKVRMDCMYLSDRLAVPLPEADDLVGWQAAYAGLVEQAEGKKLPRLDESWEEFEQYTGLSRDTRILYMRLLKLDAAVQARLIGSDLPLRHQLALGDAPLEVQEELLEAVLRNQTDIPPLKVMQATARVLSAMREQQLAAGSVLAAVRRQAASNPQQRTEELKQAVKQELGRQPSTTASLVERSNGQAEEALAGERDSPRQFDLQPPAVSEQAVAPLAEPPPSEEQPARPAPTVNSVRPELMSAEESAAVRRGKEPPVREYSAAGKDFQGITQAAQERLDHDIAAMMAGGEVAELIELLRGWGSWVGAAMTRLELSQQRSGLEDGG